MLPRVFTIETIASSAPHAKREEVARVVLDDEGYLRTRAPRRTTVFYPFQ